MRWILCAKQLLPPSPPGPARQGGSITGLELPLNPTPPLPTLPTAHTHTQAQTHTHLHTHADRYLSCMILSKSLGLPKPQFLRMRSIVANTPGCTISAYATASLPGPVPLPWDMQTWAHMHSYTLPWAFTYDLPSLMQHIRTFLLVNLHTSAHNLAYEVGGLRQGS